jgi:hypothetical protein
MILLLRETSAFGSSTRDESAAVATRRAIWNVPQLFAGWM